MSSLQVFFDEYNSRDIDTVGHYVQAHITEHWETVFQAMHAELLALYDQIGDSVYGVYGNKLFQAVHNEFKAVGLKATPKLPGSFSTSREWGDNDEERQRWMWSKITTSAGAPVGTIVIVFWHDHTQIHLPRPFGVIALKETTKGDVVRALSALSSDFAAALEAKDEYAQYR